MDLRLFGEAFVTLLVITDPPGMVPIFLALTGALPARERHRAAWQAVALAGGVIVVFAVAGQQILEYLGIDLPALQGAGGLLLLLIALDLLTGVTDDPDRAADLERRPGATGHAAARRPRRHRGHHALRTASRRARRLRSRSRRPSCWCSSRCGSRLRFSGVIVRVLRPSGIEVLTRIAGLLLAAIAVQLVADAVAAFVEAY